VNGLERLQKVMTALIADPTATIGDRSDMGALATEVMARYNLTREDAAVMVFEADPDPSLSYAEALGLVCLHAETHPLTYHTTPTGVEAEVCRDIAARQRVGIAKYGHTLESSEDDMMQHAYEEALDLAAYLKAEIIRRRENKLANSSTSSTLET